MIYTNNQCRDSPYAKSGRLQETIDDLHDICAFRDERDVIIAEIKISVSSANQVNEIERKTKIRVSGSNKFNEKYSSSSSGRTHASVMLTKNNTFFSIKIDFVNVTSTRRV